MKLKIIFKKMSENLGSMSVFERKIRNQRPKRTLKKMYHVEPLIQRPRRTRVRRVVKYGDSVPCKRPRWQSTCPRLDSPDAFPHAWTIRICSLLEQNRTVAIKRDEWPRFIYSLNAIVQFKSNRNERCLDSFSLQTRSDGRDQMR